jgi:5-(carboxyamino)imidazole ribonucleotide synthase
MINLIGHLPPRRSLLALQDVHLHDYGKSARAGRKVGHCTIVEPTPARRDARARSVLKKLAVNVRIP